MAERYLGAPLPDGITAGWVPVAQQSWRAGNRRAGCFVGRHDGTTWQASTGSLRPGTPA